MMSRSTKYYLTTIVTIHRTTNINISTHVSQSGLVEVSQCVSIDVVTEPKLS